MRRILETGKTILIVILIISAVFLARKLELFNDFFDSAPILAKISDWFGGGPSSPAPKGEVTITEAATPVYAAVTGIGGHHYGIKYDGEDLKAFYQNTGNILGEALGSSSEPVTITEDEWRVALLSAGVFFDFLYPVPLDALSEWLGTCMTHSGGNHAARRLCVSGTPDAGVYLYYRDEQSGEYFRSSTAVMYSSIASCMGAYLPNDAYFAFELGERYKNVDSYTLLVSSITRPVSVASLNPLFDTVEQEDVLSVFGINPRISTPYNESSGTVVYVNEKCTLRLYLNGFALYRVTDSTGDRARDKLLNSAYSVSEMLELARALAAESIGSASGDAKVQFTGFSYDEKEDRYTFTFDYFINGIMVRQAAYEHAAVIKIRDMDIDEAQLYYREYETGNKSLAVLPDLQAAVLVDAPGAEPCLVYFDSGSTALTAMWVNK